jgi:hypothetical protein
MIQNGCAPTPMQNNCNQILLDLFAKIFDITISYRSISFCTTKV